MKPIPTEYSGVKFRSRLEARYAMFFDSLKIGWAYEVEGIDIGRGQRYLPDFWLPDSRTYFEVKGPLRNRADLVSAAQRHVDAQSGGWIESDYPMFVMGDESGNLSIGDLPVTICLARCMDCKCWYPMILESGWTCRACGFYDGDRTHDQIIERVRLPQMQWVPGGGN